MSRSNNVREKFYDSDRYKKAHELVTKHASGLCIDQVKLPNGGIMEKWNVGGHIVVITCERRRVVDKRGEWIVEVYAPVTASNVWDDVDKALEMLANRTATIDMMGFLREYQDARDSGDYTRLDETAAQLLKE